jgi:hypothetical protein
MSHHSNLKLNNGNGEMRKEGEEYTSCRNSKALQNIEQNIESLTEKMSGFELKLNYVLLRQTKSNKRKSTLHHQDSIKSRTRQTYLKKLMNSKARIVIYLLLILILFYIILSNLSEFLLVGNELDY